VVHRSDATGPYWVVGDLTRPHPSYVSFQSALNFHGMIDQIPRDTTVASLDRARRITTTIGTYAVHTSQANSSRMDYGARGRVATPEKAIFDLAYISAARGVQPRRVPEIDLLAGFDRAAIDEWIGQDRRPAHRHHDQEGCGTDSGEGRSLRAFAAWLTSAIPGRYRVATAVATEPNTSGFEARESADSLVNRVMSGTPADP